jgi:hypothetical protein
MLANETQEIASNLGEVKHFPLVLKHTTLHSSRLVSERSFAKYIVRDTKHHETPRDKYSSAKKETNDPEKQSHAIILFNPALYLRTQSNWGDRYSLHIGLSV